MKNNQETFIELITAVLLVAMFVIYLIGGLHQGDAMLMGGLILLGSGFYQSGRDWQVSPVTWILGLILLLAGLGLRLFLVGVIRINWIPAALVLIAVYLVWRGWRRRA